MTVAGLAIARAESVSDANCIESRIERRAGAGAGDRKAYRATAAWPARRAGRAALESIIEAERERRGE